MNTMRAIMRVNFANSIPQIVYKLKKTHAKNKSFKQYRLLKDKRNTFLVITM